MTRWKTSALVPGLQKENDDDEEPRSPDESYEKLAKGRNVHALSHRRNHMLEEEGCTLDIVGR